MELQRASTMRRAAVASGVSAEQVRMSGWRMHSMETSVVTMALREMVEAAP
jgi:hypothetical protein